MLKKILLYGLTAITALLIVLVMHIVMVTGPQHGRHLANVQLARIDFASALSPTQASVIGAEVAQLNGVMHARINDDRTNLVYAYERGEQQQDHVLHVVDAMTEVPCERVVASAGAAASGCPAMVRQGPFAVLTRWVRSISR